MARRLRPEDQFPALLQAGPREGWAARAADPDCPPEVLVCLLMHHPREVLDNPSWPLVELEQATSPELWASLQLYEAQLTVMASHPRCPLGFIALLRQRRPGVRSATVLSALMANAALPAERRLDVLPEVGEAYPPAPVHAALRGLGVPLARLVLRGFTRRGPAAGAYAPAELEALWQAGGLARGLVLHQPDCAPERLREALDLDPSWAVLAAAHPRLPAAEIERLMGGRKGVQAVGLASNPALTRSQVERLAQRGTGAVRAALAARADLPEPVALLLFERGLRPCRLALAGNAHLAPSLYALLAQDPAKEVRAALSVNPAARPRP
jgi:hypothetical protein